MESPNGGMTGGAAHQTGSQGVTVPNLTHPQPTIDMGWDERAVLSLIKSEEIRANYFLDWNKEFQPLSIHVTTVTAISLILSQGLFVILSKTKLSCLCDSFFK
jgi:hypothetical protein